MSVVLSSPLDVTSETSRMIRSNSAVSSACFWLCKAIFSLNFRGFAIVVALRYDSEFFFSSGSSVNFESEALRHTLYRNKYPLTD